MNMLSSDDLVASVNSVIRIILIKLKNLQDKYGLVFDTLDPFNEPTTSFWQAFNMNQEGCHFNRDSINIILPKL